MSGASKDKRTRAELLLELGKCHQRYTRALQKITLLSLELVKSESAAAEAVTQERDLLAAIAAKNKELAEQEHARAEAIQAGKP